MHMPVGDWMNKTFSFSMFVDKMGICFYRLYSHVPSNRTLSKAVFRPDARFAEYRQYSFYKVQFPFLLYLRSGLEWTVFKQGEGKLQAVVEHRDSLRKTECGGYRYANSDCSSRDP